MLAQGVRVTINTDNPGISRTTLSREFYRAAEMCGGLSPWEVFQLIRNSFRAAFCDYRTRQQLLRKAESEIIASILQNQNASSLL